MRLAVTIAVVWGAAITVFVAWFHVACWKDDLDHDITELEQLMDRRHKR